MDAAVPDQLIYTQRERAESFGAVADDYDRYRPSYPAELVDDLLAGAPEQMLDIGCGTGKAARLFAARGVRVLGVDVDPQMAAVARRHGLAVEVSGFEDWDDRGRRFDLITAAQSWHWVDPAVGAPKAARLLRAGGLLALFWNFGELPQHTRDTVDAVYARLAPELIEPPDAGNRETHLHALRATGAFSWTEAITYSREQVWSVEDWLGSVGTHSNHLLLGPTRLGELLAELRAALLEHGSTIRTTGGTYLVRARV